MANSFFQFKKFRVEQVHNAMKVCTDSCLFGAWVNTENVTSVLDIGTGTGLLALMIAQRCSADIVGVELLQDSANEAKDNCAHSTWSERLSIDCIRVQEFASKESKKFDLIVCNPPFYKNSVRSEHKVRRVAHHDDELSFKEVAMCADALISDNGTLAVLIPTISVDEFTDVVLPYKMFPKRVLHIGDLPTSQPKRSCIEFSRNACEVSFETMSIKDLDNNYTERFIELLEEYYLYL